MLVSSSCSSIANNCYGLHQLVFSFIPEHTQLVGLVILFIKPKVCCCTLIFVFSAFHIFLDTICRYFRANYAKHQRANLNFSLVLIQVIFYFCSKQREVFGDSKVSCSFQSPPKSNVYTYLSLFFLPTFNFSCFTAISLPSYHHFLQTLLQTPVKNSKNRIFLTARRLRPQPPSNIQIFCPLPFLKPSLVMIMTGSSP